MASEQWTTTPLITIVILYVSACGARELYVDSSTTETNAPCTLSEPCASLNHAVNRSAPGDVIRIAAAPSEHIIPYIVSDLQVPWSLTFRAQQSYPPHISCPVTTSNCKIEIQTNHPDDEITKVSFENVLINSCHICMKNASGKFNETSMTNVNLAILARNQNVVVFVNSMLDDTQVSFAGLCLGKSKSRDDTCTHSSLNLTMEDTVLAGSRSGFSLTNISDVSISLQNTQFHNFQSQIMFTAKDTLNIQVNNMSLLEFNTDTAGFILSCPKGKLMGAIMNSSFNNGVYRQGGALSVTAGNTSIVNLSIVSTQFLNNTSQTAGSGINLDFQMEVDENSAGVVGPMVQTINIDSCDFIHNENGESAAAVHVGGGNVTITNTTFIENTVTTKLSIRTQSAERKGAGGAIYGMMASAIQIDGCIFVNNSANWFGGAIAGNGAILITNSYFKTSDTPRATLGELLYLSGAVRVGNLTFNITHANKNMPLIWYSSNRENILEGVGDGYLDFHCPSGSQFRNNTLPVLDTDTYKDLFYFCDPCPDNTYSLLHGYRSGSLDGTGNWSSDFECLPCAYGGVCRTGFIKSQYNFWGLASGNPPEVSMLMCPAGYCCGKTECDTYDTCAANRTGTLCGKCKPGMSERLYTTDCVDNQKCTDTWVFAVDIVISIITLLFFLYQLEIVGLACRYLFWADVSENDDPTFAGYLKSIFYFYQTIDLLKIQENQASKIVGIAVQPFISYLLTFRSIAVIFSACPFPGTTPVTKTILKSMPTIYVLSLIGILTAIYMIVVYRKKKNSSTYVQFQRPASPSKRSFGSRLAGACLSYFLYNYISISNMAFTLLACIPFGSKNVLYIDSTIECIQPWQGIFIAIAIINVCPFFMAVIVSRSLYDRGVIGTRQFFVSYFIPLPMLLYWDILYCTKWKALKGTKIEDAMNDSVNLLPKPSLSEEEVTKANILGMIEQPFINHTNAESARYWEGILIFRRMVLSAVAAFAVQPLLCITLQTLTCFSFLLWHVHIHPFGSKAANNFETVSLSILTVVATCHIIQATLLSAGISAIGPAKIQIFITDWVEWILVNLFPMLLGIALGVFIVVRLFVCCGLACKLLCIKARDSAQGRNKSDYRTPF